MSTYHEVLVDGDIIKKTGGTRDVYRAGQVQLEAEDGRQRQRVPDLVTGGGASGNGVKDTSHGLGGVGQAAVVVGSSIDGSRLDGGRTTSRWLESRGGS